MPVIRCLCEGSSAPVPASASRRQRHRLTVGMSLKRADPGIPGAVTSTTPPQNHTAFSRDAFTTGSRHHLPTRLRMIIRFSGKSAGARFLACRELLWPIVFHTGRRNRPPPESPPCGPPCPPPRPPPPPRLYPIFSGICAAPPRRRGVVAAYFRPKTAQRPASPGRALCQCDGKTGLPVIGMVAAADRIGPPVVPAMKNPASAGVSVRDGV